MIPEHLKKLFNTQVQKLGSDILYYPYDPSNTKNQYGETLGTKYLSAIPFRCVYKENPTKEELEEFGISDEANLVIRIPQKQVDEANLTPTTLDKVSVDGKEFMVKELGKHGLVNNQSVFLVIGCKRSVYENV